MSLLKLRRGISAVRYGGQSRYSTIVRVKTVEELETAIASQRYKQIIEIEAGVYQLTKSNPLVAAARYGEMRGIGDVQIDGKAGADNCFEVDPAESGGTFMYTFDNIRVRGATSKPGISVDNATVGSKIVLVFKDCSLGGTPAIDQNHTDATEAIRIYCDGWRGDKRYQGELHFTPASADDRYIFKGVEFGANLVVAAVNVACNFKFILCQLPFTGVTGGHATNICSVVKCWTIETNDAVAAADTDFPDDFSPTKI